MPKSIAKSTTSMRTGQDWSRTINRTATVKGGPRRTVVKVKRDTTNYMDMPSGGRMAKTNATSGYKKVYKNGVLKKTKYF